MLTTYHPFPVIVENTNDFLHHPLPLARLDTLDCFLHLRLLRLLEQK